MTKGQKIAKLGKEITDRANFSSARQDKITPDAEYLGINSRTDSAVKYDEKMADDILDIA